MWCKFQFVFGLFISLSAVYTFFFTLFCHPVFLLFSARLCVLDEQRKWCYLTRFLFFFSMVTMVTVSSDWGRGSNWPIVSKLHFSEWFPLSCYWNRAPALWWIHLVIHSLEGKRGKYKHDTAGGLALLKQRGYWMNKHTNTPTAEPRLQLLN